MPRQPTALPSLSVDLPIQVLEIVNKQPLESRDALVDAADFLLGIGKRQRDNDPSFEMASKTLKKRLGSNEYRALLEALEIGGAIERSKRYSNLGDKKHSKTITLTSVFDSLQSQPYEISDRTVLRRRYKYYAAEEKVRRQAIKASPLLTYIQNCCAQLLIDGVSARKSAKKYLDSKKKRDNRYHANRAKRQFEDCIVLIEQGSTVVGAPDQNKRIYPSHLQLPSTVREACLSFSNTGAVVTVDISCCHPTLLLRVQRKLAPTAVISEYAQFLKDGDYYDQLAAAWSRLANQTKTREDSKKRTMTFFYDKWRSKPDNFSLGFQALLPDTWAWFDTMKKRAGNRFIANTFMMTREQEVMQDFYNRIFIPKGIVFLPEHDGFIVGIDQAEGVDELLRVHLNNYLGDEVAKVTTNLVQVRSRTATAK